jgi:hypothetical protein
MHRNLYDLPPEDIEELPTVALSPRAALRSDQDFLLNGEVSCVALSPTSKPA